MRRTFSAIGLSALLAASTISVPTAANAALGFGVGNLAISPTSSNVNTDAVFVREIGTNVGSRGWPCGSRWCAHHQKLGFGHRSFGCRPSGDHHQRIRALAAACTASHRVG